MSAGGESGLLDFKGDGPRIVEVIASRLRTHGSGTKDDPIRGVMQLYTKDGHLICEIDTHTEVGRCNYEAMGRLMSGEEYGR